jgi:hypothetical protein
MNRPVIIFAQAGQFTRVIQVGMAQDDRIHRAGVKRQDFIELFRFLPVPLEQTALEQKFFAVDLDEIHGTGRRARGAEEVNFHGAKMPTRSGKSSVPKEILGQNAVDIRSQSVRFCSHL